VRKAVTGQLTRLPGRVVTRLGIRLAAAEKGPSVEDPTGVLKRMILLGMPQPDVRGDQVREEPQRTGAVGQRVEHFEQDPLAMVHHTEQQGAPVCLVDGAQVGSSSAVTSGRRSLSCR
jgi:hypothetical protein